MSAQSASLPPTEVQLRTQDLGLPEPPAVVLDALEAAGHARNGFCERCWGVASVRVRAQTGKTQSEHYLDIVAEANATVQISEEIQ